MDLSKMELPSNHPFAVAEQVIPCSLQRPLPHDLRGVHPCHLAIFPCTPDGKKNTRNSLGCSCCESGHHMRWRAHWPDLSSPLP